MKELVNKCQCISKSHWMSKLISEWLNKWHEQARKYEWVTVRVKSEWVNKKASDYEWASVWWVPGGTKENQIKPVWPPGQESVPNMKQEHQLLMMLNCVKTKTVKFEIWRSHVNKYEDGCPLGYYTMHTTWHNIPEDSHHYSEVLSYQPHKWVNIISWYLLYNGKNTAAWYLIKLL
jgi:hypothetical protein